MGSRAKSPPGHYPHGQNKRITTIFLLIHLPKYTTWSFRSSTSRFFHVGIIWMGNVRVDSFQQPKGDTYIVIHGYVCIYIQILGHMHMTYMHVLGHGHERLYLSFIHRLSLSPISRYPCLSTYLSICLSIHLSICLSICLSVLLAFRPSVYTN